MQIQSTQGPVYKMLQSLAQQWSVRVVPALASAERIVVPRVVGLLQPTILLPASATTGLTPSELEMVLAHELAHVRRYDMWVNLVQRLAEAALFFNPGLWYLSRRISALREYCCDEQTCGIAGHDPTAARVRYAQALLRVAEMSDSRHSTTELAALAASGRSPSELRRRVARLFGEPLREPVRLSRGALGGLAFGLALLFAGSITWQSVAEDETPKPETHTYPITVTGRALDEQGNPIENAEIVLASPRTDGAPLAAWYTNEKGEYRFENIPLPIERADTTNGRDSGSFEVFGRAEGFAFAWRTIQWFYPDRKHVLDTNPSRPPVDQRSGFGTEDKIELDLTFDAPTTLRGRIVDDTGQPIPNSKLSIKDVESLDETFSQHGLESFNWPSLVPREIKNCRTDPDGSFTFSNLPAEYRFSIGVSPPEHMGRMVYAATHEGKLPDVNGNPVYTGNFEVVFASPRQVTFQVVYRDTGKPAAKVGVGGMVNKASFWETTNDEGLVDVPLPDGTYAIAMLPRTGTAYLRTNTEVEVSAESVKEPITIKLNPAAIVDIRVVDADTGKPLKGADVWWEKHRRNSEEAYREVRGWRSWEVETRISHYEEPRSDENGKMRVFLEPGKHRIGVGKEAWPEGYNAVEIDGIELDCQVGKPLKVEFKMRNQVREPVSSSNDKSHEQELVAAKIESLQELVDSYDAIYQRIKGIGTQGGEPDKESMALYYLRTAQAELAEARGNSKQAVQRYAEALQAAEENVKFQQTLYDAGRMPLQAVLEANAQRAKAKVALSEARERLGEPRDGTDHD